MMASPLNSLTIGFWHSQNDWAAKLPKPAKFWWLPIGRCGKSRVPWLQLAWEWVWRKSRPAGDLRVQPGEVPLGLPRSSSSVPVFITLTSSAQLKERKSTLNFSALATCPATPTWHMFLQFPYLVFWQGRCQTSPAVAPPLQVVVARSPGSVLLGCWSCGVSCSCSALPVRGFACLFHLYVLWQCCRWLWGLCESLGPFVFSIPSNSMCSMQAFHRFWLQIFQALYGRLALRRKSIIHFKTIFSFFFKLLQTCKSQTMGLQSISFALGDCLPCPHLVVLLFTASQPFPCSHNCKCSLTLWHVFQTW